MLYELSESQVKNITVFLQRVDLKGSEAISLVSILQSLSSPFKEEQKNKEVSVSTNKK